MSFTATVNYAASDKDRAPKALSNLRAEPLKGLVNGMLGTYNPVWAGKVNVHALPGVKDAFGGHWLYAMVFHDGTGSALGRDPWTHEPLTYTFGCTHKYRELGTTECRDRNIYHAGRCYHVHECTACGFVNSYDSSD